jgi:Ni,Fe-hydrogenase III small subunit
MSHFVRTYDGVITIRLDGRTNAQQVYSDILNTLNSQAIPGIVILDMTLATSLDQNVKAVLYRALQHRMVARIGICGVNDVIAKDVHALIDALQRVRKITVAGTEPDLRDAFGLTMAQPKKLSGMLAYLKQ